MNRDYILYNLKEAKEALDKLIDDLENDAEYDNGNFIIDIQHIYHHINTSWNSRDSSAEQSIACSEKDFEKWRQFPVDIYMGT
jgi:uncharacterized protein YfbU (UPF0304 family)